MSIFKKKKPVAVEETSEQKIEKLKEQLRKMSDKSFQAKRMIKFFELQIEKIIQDVKNNPKDDFKIKNAQNQLKMTLLKKKIYERFDSLIDASKMNTEAKLNELRINNGNDIIDDGTIEALHKELGSYEESMKMADNITNISDLESMYNQICNVPGQAFGINVDAEAKDLLRAAINPSEKVEKNTEETVKTDTKSDVDIDSVLSKIRKDL